MAADVGKILDVVLDVKFVGAAVAAADDDDIGLGDIDHRHRIVDRRMHDIDRAVGEACALTLGAVGEFKRDVQAAPGEEAVIGRRINGSERVERKDVDVQQCRLGGVAR